MPTRFKYTPVQPQSFALTPAEILMATDAELNQYLSVKKYAPYRKDNKWDKTRVDRLKDLKQSVAERSSGAYGADGIRNFIANGDQSKKRKGKKERQKMKAGDLGVANQTKERVEIDLSMQTEAGDGSACRKRNHNELEGGDGAPEGTGTSKRKRRRKKTVQAE